MSRLLWVLDEVILMLRMVGTPPKFIERFKQQAESIEKKKPQFTVDEITVTSGYGKMSGKGYVELSLNDQLTQMDVAKAREVGLMLLQASEAAISDEALVLLLDDIGLPEEARGPMLLRIRELRQGTRGTSNPS